MTPGFPRLVVCAALACTSPVASFTPTLINLVTARVMNIFIPKARIEADSSPPALMLPPWDDTISPIIAVKELQAAPNNVEGSQRYDTVGRKSGGIWRTRVLGIISSTLVASPLSTKWMIQQEAAGNIETTLPPSAAKLHGPTSVNVLSGKAHFKVRKAFDQALSTKSALKLLPVVEASFEKRSLRWEEFAESGQEVRLLDEISSHSREVIARCFLGEYATEHVLEQIDRLYPPMCRGVMSIPLHFPWPLNKIPVLSFGPALAARKEFKDVFDSVLRKLMAHKASGRIVNGGVLDALLVAQELQPNGGTGEDSSSFDDELIFNNMCFFLSAGSDTTSALLTRILQVLGSPDGKHVVGPLLDEMNKAVVTTGGISLDGTSPVAHPKGGILAMLPLLDAVVLESARLYPILGGAFREAVRDISFNGYRIPRGTRILWNTVGASQAESLYPEPKKFCPFRFMHGDKPVSAEDGGQVDLSSEENDNCASVYSAHQPRPEMFGFGKHRCPGREVAKLQILLFLKFFMSKFDYELVNGQSFKSKLPLNTPQDNLRLVLKMKNRSAFD